MNGSYFDKYLSFQDIDSNSDTFAKNTFLRRTFTHFGIELFLDHVPNGWRALVYSTPRANDLQDFDIQ